MEPWYKVVMPRAEVREGRSFNPDEFAIALEQVVAGTAPIDYKDPVKFFERTYFTRALKEQASHVLRRLAGRTENSAPVLTLITQFGGGKTHVLTALYHLIQHGQRVAKNDGIAGLLKEAELKEVPAAKVAVFVGNAWDPRPGRETPWIDVARQLAGDAGVEALGQDAKTTPPGTESIGRLVEKAGGSVLVLFDEVLNLLNRHRKLAEAFHAFIQNLTVAMTGQSRSAAVISLPRSQVEMTDWDREWQEKITKVVRRVAKDLIANDESEISEVVRRRLFEDFGRDSMRKAVAKAYADWCFERSDRLPREWTAVDTAATDTKAREFLRARFEACYPFHPATLSVFQRKWQSLPQFQQTRGTLAMLAQWISWAYRDGYQRARTEPLITLGSAPLDVPEFKAVILGQLGEPRLGPSIDSDIAGPTSHARALDSDTKGAVKDIHRRVGTTILFESSGGQADKTARLPELRFALGEPDLDTTSIDNAAVTLEAKGFYLRPYGGDGFRFGFKPTLKKVVSDRRASLDEKEVRKATLDLIKKEFERGAAIPILPFPEDGSEVADNSKLSLVLVDPEHEWTVEGFFRATIRDWAEKRGKTNRIYPGALIWCVRKPGRDLRDKVESWLAWKRVERDLQGGTLEGDFDAADRAELVDKVAEAKEGAEDQVWSGYRFLILNDPKADDRVRVIDLGAGHLSKKDTLCGRVIAALRSEGLLNDAPGAGYLQRKWPAALLTNEAWPLQSLRQAFVNGVLERIPDPDAYLKSKIPELVAKGEFGLASGKTAGGYNKVWFSEPVPPEEITFDEDVYLLTKSRAKALKEGAQGAGGAIAAATPAAGTGGPADMSTSATPGTATGALPAAGRVQSTTLRIRGAIPRESWNRVGTKLITKLKGASKTEADLQLGVEIKVDVDSSGVAALEKELTQILEELGLAGKLRIEWE